MIHVQEPNFPSSNLLVGVTSIGCPGNFIFDGSFRAGQDLFFQAYYEIIDTTEDQIEELIDGVNDLSDDDLNQGNINSLNKKLEGAIKNITNEDPTDDSEACEKLQSFVDQLNAFVNSGKLDELQTTPLVESAEELIGDLCTV